MFIVEFLVVVHESLVAIHWRYSPLVTCCTHSALSKYQRTVLAIPEVKVSAGSQPSLRSIFRASMA
jgi:hypothetical protein